MRSPRNVGDSYGRVFEPQIIHELLDDQYGSGKKYSRGSDATPSDRGKRQRR